MRASGATIVLEGIQGADLNLYHGSYPDVMASWTVPDCLLHHAHQTWAANTPTAAQPLPGGGPGT